MKSLRVIVLVALATVACTAPPSRQQSAAETVLAEVVALERGALDRWVKLDPQGYLDLYAQDVTYFDPTTEQRVVGLEAIQKRLAPIRDLKPPFSDARYELIEPRVQPGDDMALLTFNLITYGKLSDGKERELARWNSTEAYRRIDGRWRIVHSHWSYIQGQPKPI
jgi:uncharacterized protein (TIGR02246 family)